ncbi:MAG: single-stranded-DNA-specific exonuclease RecJ, partial [Paracoccaceae bacterium]
QILNARKVGDRHLKLTIGERGGARIDAIAFSAFDSPLGPALMDAGSQPFHLAGRLEVNSWRGKQSVQLRLEDAAPAD